ncbi:MAG TPA: glycosyltransferase [Silvibacterium sp.]|nr:glycosyltransferase [Silvibacterium sp.]
MPETDDEATPASAGNRCTIVVPCYNEASRLPAGKFITFLRHTPEIYFLFVNDGSTDNTLEVLQNLQRACASSVEVLHKPVNAGKSEAVRDGMLRAIELRKGGYVGFWDADLATPLDAIPDLLQKLIDHPQLQMVFGARIRLLGREVHRKASRHYLGRVFATVVSMMLRLPIYDTQCGAKIFRITPGLSQILSQPFISRWVFDVEILARFIALNKNSNSDRENVELLQHSIYEFPLNNWEDVAGSKVGPGDFLLALVDTFRIYRKYLR